MLTARIAPTLTGRLMSLVGRGAAPQVVEDLQRCPGRVEETRLNTGFARRFKCGAKPASAERVSCPPLTERDVRLVEGGQ